MLINTFLIKKISNKFYTYIIFELFAYQKTNINEQTVIALQPIIKWKDCKRGSNCTNN